MDRNATRVTRAPHRRIAVVMAALMGASLLVPAAVDAAPSQTTPAGPVWIQTTSTGNDPVGQGVDHSYLPTTHDFAAYGSDRLLSIAAGGPDRINLWLEPASSGFAVGHHEAASRSNRGPGDATIEVRMGGRSCAYATGSFDIDEITYVDGELATLRMRFQQDCGDPADSLAGELRWDASAELPTNFPAPIPPTEGFYQASAGTFDPTRNQLLFSKWAPVTDEDAGTFERIGDLESVVSRTFEAGTGGRFEARATFVEPIISMDVSLTFQWPSRHQDLLPGLYSNLPGRNEDPTAGGFDMFLPVLGCYSGVEERRDVVIDELDLDPDAGVDGRSVDDLSMRFERTCGPGQRKMVGELRWQTPPAPGTPGLPTGVSSLAGAAAADVAWNAPTNTGATALTGYEITTYRDGLALKPATVVGPTTTATTIGGLEPGHLHTFKVAAVNAAGAGRRSMAAASAMVSGPELGPFGSTSTFVRQQYLDFAGRAPTTAETASQATALRLGTSSPQELIRTLQARPAWQSRRAAVTRLYAAYLARTPDTAGLAYWTQRLQQGVPLARVSASFAASSEFVRRYGALDDDGFVALVYQNVLGRGSDPEGRVYWIGRLAAGARRGEVMVQFSESGEHLRKSQPAVDAVLTYVGMLRRVPTAAELQAATGDTQGPAAPAVMVRSLLTSSEYARRT